MKKVLVVVIITAMHQTWGGTFKPVAETIAVGPLALAGEATLDAASGSVAFADSSAATWAEGAKLTISGGGESAAGCRRVRIFGKRTHRRAAEGDCLGRRIVRSCHA